MLRRRNAKADADRQIRLGAEPADVVDELKLTIGPMVYIGSEIRMAPGSAIAARCIVGIGSVITARLEEEGKLVAGVPAKTIKDLSSEDQFLIERKTRGDLPDDV